MSAFVDDEAFEIPSSDDEGDPVQSRARSMIFTLHVNQNIFLDGVDMGPAPVEGVPDPEELIKSFNAKYLIYGREVCNES